MASAAPGNRTDASIAGAVRGAWDADSGRRRYGSTHPFPLGIALHARRLAFRHPMIERSIEIVADVPSTWDEWNRGRW